MRDEPTLTSREVPRWWPRRYYYGWALVATLGLTTMASYGVLLYAFAAFVTPMHRDLGWSSPRITGAFSLAQLVAGVAAIPVGRWVDRHGARGLMTVGSVLASISLVGWALVRSVAAFYVVAVALGVAMALVLYEPTFAVVATWFVRRRSRALTVLTFLGGFASVVFVPLSAWLIGRYGWRGALVGLAVIYAAITIVPHWLVLRRRPADVGLPADGISVAEAPCPPNGATAASFRAVPNVSADVAIRSRAFRWLAVAFSLSALSGTAVSVHLVSLLTERGYTPAYAAGAMGLVGLMALPGRLVFTPLGEYRPRSLVTASIFALQALAAVALLVVHGVAGVWAFVILFGAGFGAITPARASLLAELFGAAQYGRIAGALALVLALARTIAPVGASWLYLAGGGPSHGYDFVLAALVVLGLASAIAVRAAGATAAAQMTTEEIAA
jgi:MFS family permease